MASSFNKPFKPPLLRQPAAELGSERDANPAKRRRVETTPTISNTKAPTKTAIPFTTYRKPLLTIPNSPNTESTVTDPSKHDGDSYYNVLWRKFTNKKHKTWDGDGTLVVRGGYAHLYDDSGKELGKTAWSKPLLSGSSLSIGGKEVEVDSMMAKEVYLSSRQCLASVPMVADETRKEGWDSKRKTNPSVSTTTDQQFIPNPASRSEPPKTKFKPPSTTLSLSGPRRPLPPPVPRHDPNQPRALVMKRPSTVPDGKLVVDVVVDPLLCKHLRDHQREGVKFLYECTMGLRPFDGQGAILADEMGLGKTLQTIALLWTLLKQNPIHGAGPVIKKGSHRLSCDADQQLAEGIPQMAWQ